MFQVSKIALIIVSASILANCDAQSVATNQVDSKGMIAYYIPEGWTDERLNSGDHYTRDGLPDDPSVMSVQVVPGPMGKRTTAEIIKNRKGKLEQQGFAEIKSSEAQGRDFYVWQGIFEGERRGEGVAWRDYLFFGDDFYFEVNLIAPTQVIDEYVPDLLTVAESVQLAEAGE
jgi:hypothetical protein